MRSEITVRGTPRLSSGERSEIMKRAWKRRRKTGTAPAKPRAKRKGPPSAIRSAAMTASWRRRQRAGTAPKAKKRKLMSHRERRQVAIAAAAVRLSRREAQMRSDCRLLGISPRSTWAEVRLAFAIARKQLRLPSKASWAVIRKALQADKPVAPRKRKSVSSTSSSTGALIPMPMHMIAA